MEVSAGNDDHPRLLRRAGLLFLLALIHRGLLAACASTISADSPFYLWAADAWRVGDVTRALRTFAGFHPFYPFLTAALARITGDPVSAGYAVSAVAGSVVAPALYLLVRRLWNERIALWTGVLGALHPVLATESSEIMTTGLFLGLLTAALALFAVAGRGLRFLLFPLSGLCAGLCYLTRPEGAALAGFFVVAVAAQAVCDRFFSTAAQTPESGDRRKPGLALGMATAALAFALIVSPYLLWLRSESGEWRLTARSSAVALWRHLLDTVTGETAPDAVRPTEAPPADPVVSDNPDHPIAVRPPALTGPVASPDPFGPTVFRKFRRAFYEPLLVLLPIGLWVTRRAGGRWARLLPLWGMAAVFWIPPVLAFALDPYYRPSHRYLLPGVVLVLPWIAAGFLALSDAVARWRPGVLARLPLLALLALCMAKTVEALRPDGIALREAGRWLREQPMPVPRTIVSSSVKIAWYAGCRIAYLPIPDVLPEADATADREGADRAPAREAAVETARRTREIYRKIDAGFLVLDDSILRKGPPGYLLELAPAGFESVRTFGGPEAPDRRQVWVYRLKKRY